MTSGVEEIPQVSFVTVLGLGIGWLWGRPLGGREA